jgi:haloalkane dehalogenase
VLQWGSVQPIVAGGRNTTRPLLTLNSLRNTTRPLLTLNSFYATPGALITEPVIEWCDQNLKKLKMIDTGQGIHFIQEDNPHLIGIELANWYKSI